MENSLLTKVRDTFASHLRNARGFATSRKIVVFESDDWGSIRMPSKEVYNRMIGSGVRVDRCPYNRFDSLAGEDDLEAMFSVLLGFTDLKGNHPVITANSVVSNPDFQKIRESGLSTYYFEPFTETLKKYPRHSKSFALWLKGMDEKIFFPQFHGREHVNVNLWLSLLKQKHPGFIQAFDNNFWGLGPNIVNAGKINIQASFDAYDQSEIDQHKAILASGLDLFRNIFGFNSGSFIANNFIWSSELNKTLRDNEVIYLQGMKYQLLPICSQNKHQKVLHYSGEKNSLGQLYLIRNASFEPSLCSHHPDVVARCIKEISISFTWRRPAIVSVHRLNFIGSIDVRNRDLNIALFKELLVQIMKKWPDVEFMTSVDLGNLIKNNHPER